MSVDLDLLSLAALQALEKEVAAAIEKRRKQERKQVLRELRDMARTRGFALEDLLADDDGAPDDRQTARRKPAAIKYRHPDQPELTWTGRGRSPQWVKDWLAGGRGIDGLRGAPA